MIHGTASMCPDPAGLSAIFEVLKTLNHSVRNG
jgi:hypothetical protein